MALPRSLAGANPAPVEAIPTFVSPTAPAGSITSNTGSLINYGERYRAGERISSCLAESTVTAVISKRFAKRQQMQWTQRGAHLRRMPSVLEELVPEAVFFSRSTAQPSRHSALIRATHWITALSFLALLVSGIEILISHPRFYWGENGNVLTPALFKLPIPSSRSLVPTGYGYVLSDQNGWSRYLHFQSAWLAVFSGLIYVVAGFVTGHFRKDLLPRGEDRSWRALWMTIIRHIRFDRPSAAEAWSYNLLQRLSYLFVIFVLFPLVIWTGLAMSPAFTSALPESVTLLGGRQSARTLHFFVATSLLVFFLVHVGMVWFAGFRSRTRTMITGRIDGPMVSVCPRPLE